MSKTFEKGNKVLIARELSDIDKHPGFIKEMEKWLSRIVTVSGIYPECKRGCCYAIEEDNGKHAWNSRWLKPLESVIRLEDEIATLYGSGNGKKNGKYHVRISDLIDKLSGVETAAATPILPTGTSFYRKSCWPLQTGPPAPRRFGFFA